MHYVAQGIILLFRFDYRGFHFQILKTSSATKDLLLFDKLKSLKVGLKEGNKIWMWQDMELDNQEEEETEWLKDCSQMVLGLGSSVSGVKEQN